MKSICVYCGSSPGADSTFMKASHELGSLLAKKEIQLVYGGAKIGLMGAVADGCLAHNGKVKGIIPKFLSKVEISHQNLTELILTESMHERKTLMAESSDGFIAMPGGFGTLEELAEILTWSQLGLVRKPIGILNINGYYDALLQLINHMSTQGFVKDSNLNLFVHDQTVEGLMDKMINLEILEGPTFDKLGLI